MIESEPSIILPRMPIAGGTSYNTEKLMGHDQKRLLVLKRKIELWSAWNIQSQISPTLADISQGKIEETLFASIYCILFI